MRGGVTGTATAKVKVRSRNHEHSPAITEMPAQTIRLDFSSWNLQNLADWYLILAKHIQKAPSQP